MPASFRGGAARDTWGYIVAVSGAESEERLDFRGTLGFGETPPDRLMILPIAPGRRGESFGGGRRGIRLQPPLVDVIVPAGTAQEAVLKDYDLQAKRPVRLEGAVPAASDHPRPIQTIESFATRQGQSHDVIPASMMRC